MVGEMMFLQLNQESTPNAKKNSNTNQAQTKRRSLFTRDEARDAELVQTAIAGGTV